MVALLCLKAFKSKNEIFVVTLFLFETKIFSSNSYDSPNWARYFISLNKFNKNETFF